MAPLEFGALRARGLTVTAPYRTLPTLSNLEVSCADHGVGGNGKPVRPHPRTRPALPPQRLVSSSGSSGHCAGAREGEPPGAIHSRARSPASRLKKHGVAAGDAGGRVHSGRPPPPHTTLISERGCAR